MESLKMCDPETLETVTSALKGLVSAIDNGITTETLRETENRATTQPSSISSLLREARSALAIIED